MLSVVAGHGRVPVGVPSTRPPPTIQVLGRALIQSGIKNERDDLLGYIASVEKHGEETKVTLETQP